jgi:TATA-box binding protein (TBP) (component of TFIID and TFIIIB)
MAATSHTAPKVNNLKGHILLTACGAQQLRETLLIYKEKKTHNNFVVVKAVHTYVIFPNKGFVNITGVKGFSLLNQIIPQFCATFSVRGEDVSSQQPVIDNISAAGDFDRWIDLTRLQQLINLPEEGRRQFSFHLDRNFFPGAVCKSPGLGVITIFKSGKYIVVGAKCQEHVDSIFQKMRVLIEAL